jgi:peptidoglycan hydrolase-like protein with peptidoglycan-binding domain/sugar lactone lactonase YvrE
MNFTKKLKFFATLFLLSLSLFIIPYFSIAYNASDVIGQTDYLGNPIYTTGSSINSTGPVNPTGFYGPYGVALDSKNHRLFTSEENNNRVLVFNLNSDNTYIDRTADYVLGQESFYLSISTTTADGLSGPRYIEYDSLHDRLFVADNGNRRILVFDVATSSISNGMDASFVLGQTDFISRTPGLTDSKFLNYISGLKYDPLTERLFVATDSRTLVFNATSTIANGASAINVLGQIDFTTSSTGTTNATTTSDLSGLAIDSEGQRLFVSDISNNRVLVFDISTSTIANGTSSINFLGQDSITSKVSTTTINGLKGPSSLDYSTSTGRLFVADRTNSRIVVYNAATSTIVNGANAINVLGQSDYISGTATTTRSGLSFPYALTLDDKNQRLFVNDSSNKRILTFDISTTTIIDGENASDVLGQSDLSGNPSYTSTLLNNVPYGGFSSPNSTFIDTVDHRLFVGDSSRVLVFNLDSNNNLLDRIVDYTITKTPGTSIGTSRVVTGLTYDFTNKRLFVSDTGNGRILVYNLSSGITTDTEASYVLGKPDFNTGASLSYSTSTIVGAYNLEYDDVNQRLFVSDGYYTSVNRWNGTSRVLVFNVSTSTISNGMDASYVLGQANFTTTSSLLNATTTRLNSTSGAAGLAYDGANNFLFVSDRGNNRILVFDVATSTIANGSSTIYVLGQTSTTSATSSLTQSGLSLPDGLYYDNTRNELFVSDYSNNRVLIYNLSSGITTGMNASAVIGQTDFTSSTSSVSQSNFASVSTRGITMDKTKRKVYIVDRTNNRVLVFGLVNITTSSLPEGTVDTAYSTTITSSSSQGILSYSITSGSIPNGLSLDSTTGTISGIPSTNGTYTFTIQATDNNGVAQTFSDSKSFTITIGRPSTILSSGGSGGGGNASPTVSTVSPTNNIDVFKSIASLPYKLGQKDKSIELLQITLKLKGYFPSTQEITGYYGPITEKALLKYQRDNLIIPISSTYEKTSAITKTPIPTYLFTKYLSVGTRDIQVKNLQKFLNNLGYTISVSGPGSIDKETEYFGPATRSALIKYQKDHNIPATGNVGPLTRISINQ